MNDAAKEKVAEAVYLLWRNRINVDQFNDMVVDVWGPTTRSRSSIGQQWFNDLVFRIHENAKSKGFWEHYREDSAHIMLIVTELAEAVQALRDGGGDYSEHIEEFLKVEEEMADAMIRIMDLCAGRGWDVAGAIIAKMKYNETRPMMHGKKF